MSAKLLHRKYDDVRALVKAGELGAEEGGKKREKRIPKAEIARVLVPEPVSDFVHDFLRGAPHEAKKPQDFLGPTTRPGTAGNRRELKVNAKRKPGDQTGPLRAEAALR